MSRSRILAVDIIADQARHIEQDAQREAASRLHAGRVYEPQPSDPLKFPWYALGSELVPMPKDGVFP